MPTLGSGETTFGNTTAGAHITPRLEWPIEGLIFSNSQRLRDLLHQPARGGSMPFFPADSRYWGQGSSSEVPSAEPSRPSAGSSTNSTFSLTEEEDAEVLKAITRAANLQDAAVVSPKTRPACWREEVTRLKPMEQDRPLFLRCTHDKIHEDVMDTMAEPDAPQTVWLDDQWKKALDYEGEGDIMFARALLQEALPVAIKAVRDGLKDASYLSEFYATLAHVCHQLGDVSDAIDHYNTAIRQERGVEAWQLQQSPSRLDANLYSRILRWLEGVCRIYVEVRQYGCALCVFKEIYDVQVDVFGSNSLEVASTLCNMGLMHYLLEMYTPSLHFYQETLRISFAFLQNFDNATNSNTDEAVSRLPMLSRSQVAMSVGDSLNAMGLLYFKLRRYDESASAFSCSLMIREKIVGRYHRDVTILFYNLAMVRLEALDARRAISLYREGLERDRVGLGDAYHPSLSPALQFLAEIYNQLGELHESSICLQQALEIECRMVIRLASSHARGGPRSDNHLASACRLLNVIGNIHLMQANVAAAMECFVQATHIAVKLAALGYPHIPLVVAGHVFCHLTRSQPECAAAA